MAVKCIASRLGRLGKASKRHETMDESSGLRLVDFRHFHGRPFEAQDQARLSSELSGLSLLYELSKHCSVDQDDFSALNDVKNNAFCDKKSLSVHDMIG